MIRVRRVHRLAGATMALLLAGHVSSPAASLKTLYSFRPSVGSTPVGTLTIAPLGAGVPYGTLFGAASSGGLANRGAIFAIQPPSAPGAGWTANIIHSFAGSSDGANPASSPRLFANGVLSGVTPGGEVWWSGLVYGLKPAKPARATNTMPAFGKPAPVPSFSFRAYQECVNKYADWAFTSPDEYPPELGELYCVSEFLRGSVHPADAYAERGSASTVPTGGPAGTPISDGQGGLYVGFAETTPQGGAVAEITPPSLSGQAWNQTILYLFGQTRGDLVTPNGPLIQDSSGALYGAASGGGAHNAGGIYRLNPPAAGQTAWTEDILWSFGGPGDGFGPNGELVRDASGAFYGTAGAGGAYGWGMAFQLTPPEAGQAAWTETNLHSFQLNVRIGDGAEPASGLYLDGAGNLFGTTQSGGTQSNGTVFELTPPPAGSSTWGEKILWSFTGGVDGAIPLGGLAADASGNLYGTTSAGGAPGTAGPYAKYGYGTVFKLKP